MVLFGVFLSNDGDIPHVHATHDLQSHHTTAFAAVDTSEGYQGGRSFFGKWLCRANPFCSSEHVPVKDDALALPKREKIAREYAAHADDLASRNAEKLRVARFQKEQVPPRDDSDDNRLLIIHPREPIDDVARKVDMPPVAPELWRDTHGQAAMANKSFRTLDNLMQKATAIKNDLTRDMMYHHGSRGSYDPKSIAGLCNEISTLRRQLDEQADNCIKAHSNFKVQLALSPHEDDATKALPRMWCTTVLKKLNNVDQMIKDTCNGTFTMHLARDKNMNLQYPVNVTVGEPPGPPVFDVKGSLDAVDQQ